MDRAGFQEFYKQNVGLIRTAARKVASRAAAIGSGTLDYDELEQELTEVFIRAYDGYDPEKYRFSTYYMRAAFNRANYLLKKQETERIENRTRSVEEMGSKYEDNDEGLSATVEDVTTIRPEEHAQIQSLLRYWHSKLSPAAQAILALTLEPPEWLCDEFHAHRAYAELCRASGVPRRAKQDLDAAYVAQLLKQITGDIIFDEALEEVRKIARNTL